MIYPTFLNNNDNISVPAPSNASENEIDIIRYKNAKKNFEKLGYKVNLSKNIAISRKGRSADASTRANEINEMFKDNSKAIICAGGGEFLIEILPFVKFEELVNNPKWIEGFSDPTGLLFPITTKYDIATIYGNNFKSFGMKDLDCNLIDNLEILEGNIIEQHSYELYESEHLEKITGNEGYNLTEKVEWKILSTSKTSKTNQKKDTNKVQIRGRIIAGCYDIITELAGTKYDGMKQFNEKYKKDGIIFCFDNCELSKEELIRSLWKLNELDYFKYAKAIIFGRNGLDKSMYYNSMEECLQDSVISKLEIPIIYDADISHKSPCLTIINGAIANIECTNGKGNISFELI